MGAGGSTPALDEGQLSFLLHTTGHTRLGPRIWFQQTAVICQGQVLQERSPTSLYFRSSLPHGCGRPGGVLRWSLPPCPPGIPKPASPCTLQGSSQEMDTHPASAAWVEIRTPCCWWGRSNGSPRGIRQGPRIPAGCTQGSKDTAHTEPAQKQQPRTVHDRQGEINPKARWRLTGHGKLRAINRNEADPRSNTGHLANSTPGWSQL